MGEFYNIYNYYKRYGLKWYFIKEMVKDIRQVFYNIKNKKINSEVINMGNEEFKKATPGDVVKFEKAGDTISGKYIGYEESKQYAKSYAVKVDTAEGIKAVFVSGIVIDLIESNSITKGTEIIIEYLGKKKSETSGREYNTYDLHYK